MNDRNRVDLVLHLDEEEPEQDADQAGRADTHLDRQLLEARTILVAGAVSDRMARQIAGRLLIMEQADPDRQVTVFINSPGGSADSGFAIYDLLRFVSCPVRTVVNGLCASAAVLIHLAADRGQRFTLPQSRFLLHQPSTASFGTASDLDITAREVLKLRERYNSIICDATGQDPQKVLEDVRRDFWLNAKEALDYGLVDRVVSTRKELP